MELTISRIGNSDGIILPKKLMKKWGLHRTDVLIIDEESPDIVLRKKVKNLKYEGPNTGFFAPLADNNEDNSAWGGDKSSEEYLAELRKDEEEKDIVTL